MENQILKAVNHIQYGSKEKLCPFKVFNYLQNNEASNYKFPCIRGKPYTIMLLIKVLKLPIQQKNFKLPLK